MAKHKSLYWSAEKIAAQNLNQKHSFCNGVTCINPLHPNGKKQNYQQDRIYTTTGKYPVLLAAIGNRNNITHNGCIRRLSIREQARLQTLPDSYDFSSTTEQQAAKMLGNGWTVAVITHILKDMKLTHTQLAEGITVISFFDGMACGLQALKDAGIKVKAYYAAEIDKPAMQVARNNHPEIIHIGDVTKVHYMNGVLCTEAGTFEIGKADLIIGGSPCQGFSFAGKQLNFEDPRSKLFFEYHRVYCELKEANPDLLFMLENVRMKQESKDVISQYLGVQPEPINSALFSAQSRPRLYWTNINFDKNIVDRGILIQDILEPLPDIAPKYFHTDKALAYMMQGNEKWTGKKTRMEHYSKSEEGKSKCLTANMHKGVPYNVVLVKRGNFKARLNQDKATCLMGTEKGCGNHSDADFVLYNNLILRKYTPLECERLQTMPDNYTAGVSDSQRYKMLGNGWNKDTVQHIFSGMLSEATVAPKPAFILTYNGNSVKLSEEQQQALEAFAATLGKLKLTVKV